jgi:hypothetical protein
LNSDYSDRLLDWDPSPMAGCFLRSAVRRLAPDSPIRWRGLARQTSKDRLKKAGAQIEAVRGADERNRQADARKDGNHLEYLDVKFGLGKCVRKNLRDNNHP